MFISHHDAAHSGLVFHPALPASGCASRRGSTRRRTRASRSCSACSSARCSRRSAASPGGCGPRRLGRLFSAGATAAMADIGSRDVVPGANDNLSSVGAIVALAHALREQPVHGVRVILLSTGSEESFMEGMQGFGRRHFPALPARDHGVRVPRVRRLALPVRGGGRGDAAHAPLPRGGARGAGPGGRGRGRAAAPGAEDRGRHRRADRPAGGLPGVHARRRGRDQVPVQLPLAQRRAGQPHLGVGGGGGGVCEAYVARPPLQD